MPSLTIPAMAIADTKITTGPKRDALADRLTAHFAPQIADMGLELLQLRLIGSPRSGLRLDVRVDRQPGQGGPAQC